MGNKVKMSEFDLRELRVSYGFLMSHQKTFSRIGFLTKKDFYQIFIFPLGLVKNCQNMNRLSAIKIELGAGKI